VKKEDHFKVDKSLQKFYQGEVLVPSRVPAHLIDIPSTDIFKQRLTSSLRPEPDACTGLVTARAVVPGVSSPTIVPTVPTMKASSSPLCDTPSRTTTDPEIKSDPSCGPVKCGGIVAIKADGDCCYHLAGVIGSLCKTGELASLHAPCSTAELSAARTKILDNFRRWKDSKRPLCTNDAELEALVEKATYETSDSLEARVSGIAKGKDRWGSPTDLALYTLYEDVRVVVVDADEILCETPDEELLASCTVATFDGSSAKSRVVCAVLSKCHYQLGVVSDAQVRAVFKEGAEWDSALQLILKFIKRKARRSRTETPAALGPQWAPEPRSQRPTERATSGARERPERATDRASDRPSGRPTERANDRATDRSERASDRPCERP
jgi:hypothetical protein